MITKPLNFSEYIEQEVKITKEDYDKLPVSKHSDMMESYIAYINDFNPKAGDMTPVQRTMIDESKYINSVGV